MRNFILFKNNAIKEYRKTYKTYKYTYSKVYQIGDYVTTIANDRLGRKKI